MIGRSRDQLVATLLWVSLWSSTLWPLPALAAERVGGVVGGAAVLDQAYSDNVYQAPGPNQQGGFFSDMTGRLDYFPNRDRWPRILAMFVNGRVYASHSDLNYIQFGPRAAYRLGRYDLFLDYTFNPHKFAFPEEDGNIRRGLYYEENDVETGVRGKFLARNALRLDLLYQATWASYDQTHQERDSFYSAVNGEARYQFRSGVTPLAGFEYGHRFARRDNFNRDQTDLRAGIDIELPYATRLRFRYRASWRDYTVGSAKENGRRNANYGREDRIDEYHTWLDTAVPLLPGLRAGVRYRYSHGEFDAPNRRLPNGTVGEQTSFDVNEVGVMIGYWF